MEDLWLNLGLRDETLLGIPLTRWAAFLTLTIVFHIGLLLVLRIARRRLERYVQRTEHEYYDYLLRLVEHTWRLSLLAFAAFITLYFVDLKTVDDDATVEQTVRVVALVLIALQFGRWGSSLIDEGLKKGFRFANFSETAARTAYGVVRFFAMVALWTSVAILILSVLEIPITPLLAGLGVGGIAVGFALQHILSDIFCSVAIVLDRPFEVGDFIISGDHMGVVEHIGVKTTRVRSLGGEQIIFPNSDLIGSRVRNYKRMQERRITFSFGVLYATAAETLEQIPGLVRDIINGIDQTRFDRAHFAAFGDSSLNFEVVFYVLTPDYNQYMDIQQRINLEILRALERIGVGFAFPSRTLYVEGTKAPLRTQVLLMDGSKPNRA